jgi:DNA-binding beta-propeller fold protein YncE
MESGWYITVIDANTWKSLADIQLPGKAGFARTGGNGHVYLSVQGRNDLLGRYEVARLQADALGEMLRSKDAETHATVGPTPKEEQLRNGPLLDPDHGWQRYPAQMLDWSGGRNSADNDESQITFFPLARECGEPRTLAVDERHLRLFVACGNMTLAVLNADTGAPVASLPTGPGTNAVAYDFDHGLIYAANSGGNGSLTIIRQDVTDTYSVIQNLPTYQRARALAVNQTTGQAYLVTDYTDSGPDQRRSVPASGSFYVQVIGH